MGIDRQKMKEGERYAPTLDAVIVALCRDLGRRERALMRGDCSARVAMEYRYVNSRIYEAAEEIAGAHYARIYIEEIGARTGWVSSRITLSEGAYKEEKLAVKRNIARKLHLMDGGGDASP